MSTALENLRNFVCAIPLSRQEYHAGASPADNVRSRSLIAQHSSFARSIAGKQVSSIWRSFKSADSVGQALPLQ